MILTMSMNGKPSMTSVRKRNFAYKPENGGRGRRGTETRVSIHDMFLHPPEIQGEYTKGRSALPSVRYHFTANLARTKTGTLQGTADYLLPDSLLHKLGSNVATKNLPTSCYTGIGPLLKVLLLTGQRLIATSVPTRCYETTDRSTHETLDSLLLHK